MALGVMALGVMALGVMALGVIRIPARSCGRIGSLTSGQTC